MSTAQSEAARRYFEHLCQLLYKTHPVEILGAQVGEASERCYGLIADIEYAYVQKLEHGEDWTALVQVPREGINFDPRVKYIEPAQRATSLALSAAYDIGRWLRYSLGEEAGVFETKLRTVLDALNSDIRDMPQLMFMERTRARWEQNVEELEKLHGVLKTVALRDEYPDTEQTLSQVKALHAALVNVKERMRGLAVDARNSERDRVHCHSHRLRNELLPTLADCVAPIASRLQYVLNYDASSALEFALDHKNAGKAPLTYLTYTSPHWPNEWVAAKFTLFGGRCPIPGRETASFHASRNDGIRRLPTRRVSWSCGSTTSSGRRPKG
ncbi:MAG: hypothetical protein JSU86_19965 [Phycisphaerales bacterium]|nr:MAG: hypothetical protein JSU86_19965 [Phycisphaerales bacterium]